MQIATSNSTNNNSAGPDGINIRHFKHLGRLAIRYLTNMYNLALNTNTISHLWKRAAIISIPKLNKDHNIGANYRPILLLLPIAKILEKTLLPYITENIPIISYQHGFKHKRSTHTALDMSKAFDTVNIYKFIHKLTLTNISNIIIKLTAKYIKGRQQHTLKTRTNQHWSTTRWSSVSNIQHLHL